MGWVIRIPSSHRAERGRRGSRDPGDLYHWRLWTHWPLHKRALVFGLRLIREIVVATMMLKLRRMGGRWSDLRVCRRLGLLPRDVRNARDAGLQAGADDMIGQWDKKGMDLMLNPRAFPKAGNLLFDKHAFAALVAEIPTMPGIPTFGAVDLADGLPIWVGQVDALIFKPGFSSHGDGIFKIARQGNYWLTNRGAAPEIVDDLLGWCRRTMRKGDVVQKLMQPSPELATLSPAALPTLRVVTCLDEQGLPEVVNASLRLGSGGGVIDNFGAGGLAAPLDLLSGRAGRARVQDEHKRMRLVEKHPLTGAPIEGFILADKERCFELARLAHCALAEHDFKMVGWDIGLDANGPVLIEGNWNPNSDLIQIVGRHGIAGTRLGELYRFHLAAIAGPVWRRSPMLMRG